MYIISWRYGGVYTKWNTHRVMFPTRKEANALARKMVVASFPPVEVEVKHITNKNK